MDDSEQQEQEHKADETAKGNEESVHIVILRLVIVVVEILHVSFLSYLYVHNHTPVRAGV